MWSTLRRTTSPASTWQVASYYWRNVLTVVHRVFRMAPLDHTHQQACTRCRAREVRSPGAPLHWLPTQVFEYCSTDLKKYMDRLGKGPAFPLSLVVIKVRWLLGVG